MTAFTLQLSGSAETLRNLRRLATDGRERAIRSAFEAGAEAIVREAKFLAPVASGGYRRRIASYALRRELARRVRAFAPHSHLIEHGTKERHTSSGRSSGRMPAQHVLERAVETSRAAYAMETTLAREVRREWERRRGR